jgi:hypothetical protein
MIYHIFEYSNIPMTDRLRTKMETTPSNEGVVDRLLECPEKGYFVVDSAPTLGEKRGPTATSTIW